MSLPLLSVHQLEAIAAVCDAGSFDAAATRLHVTASALSQRVSTLERTLGRLLVRRDRPLRPTPDGEIVLRLARASLTLQAECQRDLAGPDGAGRVRLELALNADSLSTWFPPVLRTLATEDRLLLTLHVEDQDRTAALLRAGQVAAAVTTDARPAPGCTAHPLGVMRYLPVCSPDLLDRMGGDPASEEALAATPMLRFGPDDDLPRQLLRAQRSAESSPTHDIPANREFLDAVRVGLGWSVLPEGQIETELAEGTLVRLLPGRHLHVRLYWQRWRVASATLEHVTDLVIAAARAGLHRPSRARAPGSVRDA